MPTPDDLTTEWRVCAEPLPEMRLGWRVRVYVRALRGDMPPGGWKLVHDTEYRAPMGQLKQTYWKELLKGAAA